MSESVDIFHCLDPRNERKCGNRWTEGHRLHVYKCSNPHCAYKQISLVTCYGASTQICAYLHQCFPNPFTNISFSITSAKKSLAPLQRDSTCTVYICYNPYLLKMCTHNHVYTCTYNYIYVQQECSTIPLQGLWLSTSYQIQFHISVKKCITKIDYLLTPLIRIIAVRECAWVHKQTEQNMHNTFYTQVHIYMYLDS